MREYWVYELRAGDWLYIGMTSNVKSRLKNHRTQIRAKRKPEWWSSALEEFPHPDDWKIEIVAGPYSDRDDAVSEEMRRQEINWSCAGRLWDFLGDKMGPETKLKIVSANTEEFRKTKSDNLKGRKQPEEAVKRRNTSNTGKKRSKEFSLRISAARKEYWARKRAEKFFDWFGDPT